MEPIGTLTINGTAHAITGVERDTLGRLTLTLAQPVRLEPKRKEPMLMLRLGTTVEPVKLVSWPEGTTVLVQLVYY